jgi:hypothetical protein
VVNATSFVGLQELLASPIAVTTSVVNAIFNYVRMLTHTITFTEDLTQSVTFTKDLSQTVTFVEDLTQTTTFEEG